MRKILAFGILVILGILLFINPHRFDINEFYTQIPNGSEEIGEMLPFLDQSYTYLAEGSQMMAFLSEDGQTVLKIFKAKHKKPFKVTRIIRSIKSDEQKRANSRNKWRLKFLDTCRRYKMAYTHLKEETGLIGLHFHKTSSPLFVTLIKKQSHSFDLSNLPFILQKKVTLAPIYTREHPMKAESALRELFAKRIEKGFSDPRQTLSTNYGFINDRAIQLDVGKIERFEGDQSEELSKIYERLSRWISAL